MQFSAEQAWIILALATEIIQIRLSDLYIYGPYFSHIHKKIERCPRDEPVVKIVSEGEIQSKER